MILKIDKDVLDVLVASTVDNNKLFLPNMQLDRKLYVSTNKVLESIGGKWNSKAKAHLFDKDISGILDELINTGEYTDAKKEFQFFETPYELASRLVYLAEINTPQDLVLEPSCGKGRIIGYAIKESRSVFGIELNTENYECCKKNFPLVNIVNADFLDPSLFLNKDFPFEFDKVIMNPPFSSGQDVKHVFQAWDLVKSGGRLVSIVSESPFFRTTKLAISFREWLSDNNAEIIDLDAGAFKESGTNVKTRIIVVDK